MNESEIKFEPAECPKCGSATSREIASGRDHLYGVPGIFHAARCSACGLWFQNPRPAPTETVLLYPAHYGPHSGAEIPTTKPEKPSAGPSFSRAAKRSGKAFAARFLWRLEPRSYLASQLDYRHLWREGGKVRWPLLDAVKQRSAGLNLIPRFVDGGRLLEVGCATGSRLEMLRKIGWTDLHGLEMVDAAAEIARARGFAVKTGVVENEIERYPDGHFDAIVSSFVLEHLYNPFAVVGMLARKLKPGGEFLFSTVCRNAIDAKIYGRYWAGYDFPRHMVFFSKKDLRDMIESDFTKAEFRCQSAFIDFVRSSSWRIQDGCGNAWDRFAVAAGNTRFTNGLLAPFAWAKATTRIFVRCTKRRG